MIPAFLELPLPALSFPASRPPIVPGWRRGGNGRIGGWEAGKERAGSGGEKGGKREF